MGKKLIPFRVIGYGEVFIEDLFPSEQAAIQAMVRIGVEVCKVEQIDECTRCGEKKSSLKHVYGTFMCSECERAREKAYRRANSYMCATARDEAEEYYSIES